MNPTFLDNMSWEMAEVYGAITDRILINLARYFPYINAGNVPKSSFDYQAVMLAQMGQVNADTLRIIKNSLQGANQALSNVLEQAIIDAVSKAEKPLLKGVQAGILKPAGIPVVAPNQYRAFELYYQQAADKLNLVNTVMLESTKQAYQACITDVVSEIALAERLDATFKALDVAAGETITGVSTWNQALRHAMDKLKDRGITGFIDHAGRRWSAESYVAMDIRSTVYNTGRAAVWETNQNFGNDLYIVSYHDGARPLCYPWQNKVISSTNNAREVADLDGNTVQVYAQSDTSYGEPAGLFGINCKHYPSPFIPGVSVAYDSGNIVSEEQNRKVYEQTQQQRGLERKLREEKRDLLIAKARGANDEEIKALRAKCRQTSDDIDTFCQETGLPRRQNREGVFTKRDFPDADKYDPKDFERTQKDEIEKFFSNGGAQQGYTFGQMTPSEPITPSENVASQVTTEPPKVVELPKATNPIVTEQLPKSGIKPLDVVKLEKPMEESDIIKRIGGGDETKGSCSSLAYTYAGQKAGYDVRDFRGGKSQEFFSKNWLNIAKFKDADGVNIGITHTDKNGFTGANYVLNMVESGKEYYFSAGRHAAIVRRSEQGLEYLELQSSTFGGAYGNGWHSLDNDELKSRFGVMRSSKRYTLISSLIDIDKFAQSADFVEMLKYINTEAGKEKAGIYGGRK